MIPITFDYAFKSVFSKNKDILKKFLISVLDLDISEDECNIKFDNVELLKDNKKEYSKTIDLNVILHNGIYIDIEVNRKNFNSVKLRNFLFANKFYSRILETGEDPKELNDRYVYQLNLNTKDKSTEFGEDIVIPYGIKTNQVYVNQFQIIVKYLEFYRKLYYNEGVKLKKSEIWLASLTAQNFSELKEMLSHILSEEETDRIIGDMITMSKDEFILHEWKKDVMDGLVKLEEERIHEEEKKAAVAEGIAEGESKGSKDKSIEIAKNLLGMGMEIEKISEATGLKVSEIEDLK